MKTNKAFRYGSSVIRSVTGLVRLLLMLLIDALMVRTVGIRNLPKALGAGKSTLLVLLNLLILTVIFAGPVLKDRLLQTHARMRKAADWLLLAGTPLLQFFLVQLILDKKINVSGGCIWKNLLIYYWLLIFLLLLLRKAAWICTLSGFFWIILALTEYYVMEFRGQAFTLADIFGARTAMTVVGGYHFDIPPALAALLLAFLLYEAFQSRFQQLKIGFRSAKSIVLRLAVLAVMLLAPLLQEDFFISADSLEVFRLDLQYSTKGYAYVLAGEAGYLKAQEPEGYSPEAVSEIARKYASPETQEAASVQSFADETPVTPENVIVIMNESFADLENAGNLKANEEILPNLHSLTGQGNVKWGSLYVPTFGGGTCETEYEVLTGNFVQFLPAASLVYQFYTKEPEYGLVSSFENQGYRTVAIHPNHAYSWNRDEAYSAMGFDEFLNSDNWGGDYEEKIREFASDSLVYDRIIRLYEEKEEGEKLFTFCVTIQNHGGYGEEMLLGYEPDVRLGYEEDFPEAETYLSLAKESDAAFMELISYFEEAEEPTMVVMFGDHWPAVEDEFLTLLQADTGLTEVEKQRLRYSTPYVIWTNYASEGGEKDMSANYLGAYILSQAGLELTPWQQFQLAMQEEIPAIAIGGQAQTADGSWTAIADLPENLARWISDYKILEYNNVFDRGSRVDSIFAGQ